MLQCMYASDMRKINKYIKLYTLHSIKDKFVRKKSFIEQFSVERFGVDDIIV